MVISKGRLRQTSGLYRWTWGPREGHQISGRPTPSNDLKGYAIDSRKFELLQQVYRWFSSNLHQLIKADFHARLYHLRKRIMHSLMEKRSRPASKYRSLCSNIKFLQQLSYAILTQLRTLWLLAMQLNGLGTLVQMKSVKIIPVMFTSRNLKSYKLNYSTVKKEVLALLKRLESCYTTLITRFLNVLTRHSKLGWLV